MSLSTSVSAIDNTGTVFVYIPPDVVAIPRGFNVANGNYNQITAGAQVSLQGTYQFANGSGALQALGQVVYRVVTITAPPAPQQEETQGLGDQIPDAV